MAEVITIQVHELLKDDVLVNNDHEPFSSNVDHDTVTDVQVLGPVSIIDFADNTATPPIPSNAPITVRRG